MLDMISEGFSRAKQRFSGKAVLDESNLADALNEVQQSLLEADVAYDVVKSFTKSVKEKLIGESVQLRAGSGSNRLRVTPGEHFIKACHEELVALMGGESANEELNLATNRPAVIMMVGLQGSGKTTTSAKLSSYLIRKKARKPLLVAADVYRPAAQEQLRVLGEKLGVPVFTENTRDAVSICRNALAKAYELGCDALILDTAGRVTVDEVLMQELSNICEVSKPDHVFFVCDAMMGQDALPTVRAFNDRLHLTGVVMTKMDGDARGGAALSIRAETGCSIRFIGVGEDLDRLEEFRAEGVASRILGMGDVLSLMDDFDRAAEEDTQESAEKMLRGKFTFEDFYKQISMIQKMGSLKDIAAKIPLPGMIPKDANLDDSELTRAKSMIDSMTKLERSRPILMKDVGRVRRVAKGSGRSIRDVENLVKKFMQMQQMMSMLGQGAGGLMSKLGGLGGGLSQLARAGAAAAGGGAGGLGSLFGGMGGMGAGMAAGQSASFTKKKTDKDLLRKQKKAARKAKKKNRK